MPARPKIKTKAETAATQVVRFKIEGREYLVRPGEISARVAMEIRSLHCCTWREVTQHLDDGSADLDDIAALLYVARRQNGEPADAVSYDAILDSLDYATDFEPIVVDDEDASDDPEASGAE